MILGQGLRLGGIGIALGVLAAMVATRLLETMLYGVSGSDPIALGAAAVASWLPARRAARVDPIVALRQE
jgi:ABC-type lipoprotein release transport system permease subunit